MGHQISGVVAEAPTFLRIAGPLAGQPSFALRGDLAFLPLDHENLDGIVGSPAGKAVGEFLHLSARLIDVLCEASRAGVLVYVETEYFGSAGEQGAAVFRDGTMISVPDWREAGAINDALRILAIAPGSGDLFERAGLAAFRHNEDIRPLTDD